MTILEQLADHARARVAAAKEKAGLDTLQAQCRSLERTLGRGQGKERFQKALSKPGLSFLCELKKASPSKGLIDPEFPYLDIAKDYEAAGADAVSCLTEPKWFLGSDDIFRRVRQTVSLPMLRKDFTVDPYQIYEARLIGADCVLLICALLDTQTLNEYLKLCQELGLAALVETHDEDEVRSALAAGATILGGEQPQPQGFLGGLPERQAAAGPHPAGGTLRGRVGDKRPPGRSRAEGGGGRRSAHRGDPDARSQ